MVDLHRDPAFLADAHRLVQRLEKLVALAAHVRDVDATIRRHRFRGVDQLLGARIGVRRVDERARDPECTVLHGASDHSTRGVALSGGECARLVTLGVDAEGAVAEEGADVLRRAAGDHVVEPRAEPVRATELRDAPTNRGVALRGKDLVVHGTDRRAFTVDGRGDSLRDHRERAAIAQHVVRDGVRLDVDEARRDDVTCRIDARPRTRGAKCAARADRRDAIAAQRDVAVIPRRTGAVDHATILDHHVEGGGGAGSTAANRGGRRAGSHSCEKDKAEQYSRTGRNGAHWKVSVRGQWKAPRPAAIARGRHACRRSCRIRWGRVRRTKARAQPAYLPAMADLVLGDVEPREVRIHRRGRNE